jgi:phosphoadenosine phosphosulfate reductase
MTLPDLVTAAEDARALADLNNWLATRSAEQRVAWALESLAGEHALSSSFGAQAAVSLHMLTCRLF